MELVGDRGKFTKFVRLFENAIDSVLIDSNDNYFTPNAFHIMDIVW